MLFRKRKSRAPLNPIRGAPGQSNAMSWDIRRRFWRALPSFVRIHTLLDCSPRILNTISYTPRVIAADGTAPNNVLPYNQFKLIQVPYWLIISPTTTSPPIAGTKKPPNIRRSPITIPSIVPITPLFFSRRILQTSMDTSKIITHKKGLIGANTMPPISQLITNPRCAFVLWPAWNPDRTPLTKIDMQEIPIGIQNV